MDYQALKDENSRQLREDYRERRTVFQAMPEIISLNHSNICDLRCTICWHHEEVPPVRLGVPQVESIAHQLFPTAQKVILTAAGEPTINDFEEIITLAREYSTKVDMFTAALNMTEERYRLVKPVLDVFHVSMDTSRKELYELVRARSNYDRVVENLKMMRRINQEEGKRHIWIMNGAILKDTVPYLAEFVAFAHEMGADMLQLQKLFFTHEALREQDIFTRMPKEELDGYMRAAQEEARKRNFTLILHELTYENVYSDPPVRSEDPPLMHEAMCWFAVQQIGIQPTGEVYPCCYPTTMNMGHIEDTPLREIWNGAGYRKLRHELFTKDYNYFCKNCMLITREVQDDKAFDFYGRQTRMKAAFYKNKIKRKLFQIVNG